MNNLIRFLKDWTLPVSITVGTVCYLTFYYVPQLDELGTQLAPVFDVIFPLFVFLTLFVTFCKVDFHQMRPHRWHVGVLVAQLLLVAVNIGIIFYVKEDVGQKLLWEAILTCIIGPAASASPVVTGKLGGNISTMTTYVLISSLVSALLIPLVFPMLEQAIKVSFIEAFLIILEKVSIVLLLPLVLGWIMQHYVKSVCARIAAMPNLSFYCWAISLSITTGITVKNIVHSEATLSLLLAIAAATFVLCWVQFGIGRVIGRHLGEEVNAGQALFQKNTALSIWVAYMYLHPVASIGAGCYVLWQNIINSIELWQYRKMSGG
jgi:BASS family bile acid:Na+ symporter